VCSPVIVPAAALAALPGPSYNFHPGPPTRPGRYPSVFALYDGDDRFGVTVHEMAARVDSGPIVAVDWFDVPPDCTLAVLERLTLNRLIALFRELAPHLARTAAPLPRLGVLWSGGKTTLAQVDALRRITPDLSPAEAERRRRACGGQVIETADPGWLAPPP
jgi:methionyl-tRNA formyltransferase